MAKPPKNANNGVEEAIDAGAHPVVASMERQHSPLDREHSALDRGHSAFDGGYSPLDRGHIAPDRGPSAPIHNMAPSEPSTVPSQNFVFPKTKSEAREAAKALLDAGPARREHGLMPGVQPRSSLQKPGKSRQSLMEKTREVHAALKRTLDQLSVSGGRDALVKRMRAGKFRPDLRCVARAASGSGRRPYR